MFVFFTLPGRILDMIPASTLLGSIIALGLLADNNELLAMRANGISVKRICWSVILAAIFPMLAAGILAEFIVPPLEQHAQTRRLAAMGDAEITFTKGGFWARKGPFFVHVREIRHGGIPVDVDIFEWSPEGRLRAFTHARKADITEDKKWVLTDIEQRAVTKHGITKRSLNTLSLESFLSEEQMAIQKLPPESLSPSDLYQYIQLLRDRGQNADQFKMVFWQKVSTPLTTGAMVLLSLTFVFGPTRGITAGHRIMMGSTVGVVLYFFNQIIGHFGLILGVNPVLTTMAPVAVVLFIAIWLLSRGP
jgi:lipopolysaccharide export system permease protein